jgi:Terpene synthase family 2, C-terminal metal binding
LAHQDQLDRLIELAGGFPWSPAPDSEAIERRLGEWLRRSALVEEPEKRERLLRSRCGWAFAGIHPHAPRERVLLISKVSIWMLAFDDVHGERRAAADLGAFAHKISQISAVLDGVAPPEDRFLGALAALLSELDPIATPFQRYRVRNALRSYAFALLWEAGRCFGGWPPPLREYQAMRSRTIGMEVLVALTDLVEALPLGLDLSLDRTVERSVRAVCDVVGWANDVYSFDRESVPGGTAPVALPSVLAADRGISLTEGFVRALKMLEDRTRDLRTLTAELSSREESSLRAYAACMERHVGVIASYHAVGRYRP